MGLAQRPAYVYSSGNVMKQYWNVYKEFLKTCFAEASTYRLHFALLIIMDNVFYLTSLSAVSFIFDHVDTIGPWSKSEFMFFISFMLVVDYFHMTFVSENFWMFSYNLRMGMLDFILIKPLGAMFTIFFRHIRPSTLFNFWVPLGCITYFGNQLGLGWSDWVLLPFLIIMALVLLTSLEILISMSMFWVIEAVGINFLRMQLQQLSRWPDFVYKYYAKKFFTIILPILLVGSGPVTFFLDRNQWPMLVAMFAAILVSWLFIRYFWQLGLRHYESASS